MTENRKADVSLSRTPLRIFIARVVAGPRGTHANARVPIEHGIAGGETLRGAWRGSALIFHALFRLFRPFYRWQCLDVGRHRVAVFGRELRGIALHRGHRAADRIAFGGLTGFQEIRDILAGIVTKALLRDIGNPALALGIGSAGKA